MMRPFSDVDLHAFVDGQINPERRALIDAYLKATPAEAAQVDLWRRQNEAIRSVFGGAAQEPVPLWLTIGQVAAGRERPTGAGLDPIQDNRLSRTTPTRRARAPLARSSWARRLAKPGAIALVAFVAGAALPYVAPEWPDVLERWLPPTPRIQQLNQLAIRTLEAHRTFGSDLDRPVEILDAPRGALAGWFKRHIAFPVRVPDLARLGWTLRGGRIVPGDLGPSALMVYENAAGERLSLVAARVTNPSPADTAYVLLSGGVLGWLDGPVGFGLTTSKDEAWLADNAKDLYRAVYGGAEE